MICNINYFTIFFCWLEKRFHLGSQSEINKDDKKMLYQGVRKKRENKMKNCSKVYYRYLLPLF